MYNGTKIITGLVIFVLLLTSPFILNIGKADAQTTSSFDKPVISLLDENQNMESLELMPADHMQLLNEWRDQVIREGNTVYVSSSGKAYEISLNKTESCDSCHTYVGVDPYCWDCHNAAKGVGL